MGRKTRSPLSKFARGGRILVGNVYVAHRDLVCAHKVTTEMVKNK